MDTFTIILLIAFVVVGVSIPIVDANFARKSLHSRNKEYLKLFDEYKKLYRFNAKSALANNKHNLSGSSLSRADLRDSDLSEAELNGANLEGANLEGANLSGANLDGVTFPEGYGKIPTTNYLLP